MADKELRLLLTLSGLREEPNVFLAGVRDKHWHRGEALLSFAGGLVPAPANPVLDARVILTASRRSHLPSRQYCHSFSHGQRIWAVFWRTGESEICILGKSLRGTGIGTTVLVLVEWTRDPKKPAPSSATKVTQCCGTKKKDQVCLGRLRDWGKEHNRARNSHYSLSNWPCSTVVSRAS
jgi:hypothetical protein